MQPGCWLVVVGILACGDPNTVPDAPTRDADLDAPADAAIDGIADTLACVSNGTTGSLTIDGPSVDLGDALQFTVLVHDATGAVASRSALLDADATYAVDVASCGMVTVHSVESPQQLVRIVTWTGVQPGDHLIHPRREVARTEYDLEISVGELTGATEYGLSIACSDGRGASGLVAPGITQYTIACPTGSSSVSVLARAESSTSTSFAVFDDVALAEGSTTSITIDAWQPTTATVTVAVDDVASFASGSGIVHAFRSTTADRVVGDGSYGASFNVLPSPEASFEPIPVLSGAGGVIVWLWSPTSAEPRRALVYARSFAAVPSTVSLTVGLDTLPLLSASMTDPVQPTITWSSDRPLQADAMAAEVEYYSSTRWFLVAPAVPGVVRFPELPNDLQPQEPTVDRFSVLAGDSATASDYAAVRQLPALLALESNGVHTTSTGVTYRP